MENKFVHTRAVFVCRGQRREEAGRCHSEVVHVEGIGDLGVKGLCGGRGVCGRGWGVAQG